MTSTLRMEGGFVQCGYFADKGGFSDADARTFWCKKTLDFSKFMVCPHGQGGKCLNVPG